MSDQKPKFGTSTTITVSSALTGLASSATAGWQSGAIDNTSDLGWGFKIRLNVTVANTTPGSDKTVYVYVYESEDGSDYTDNATGSEGALTIRDPTNLKLIGTIATPTQNLQYKQVFEYVPAAPARKWGIVVINFTGMAFTAAAASYTAIQGQSV